MFFNYNVIKIIIVMILIMMMSVKNMLKQQTGYTRRTRGFFCPRNYSSMVAEMRPALLCAV